MKIRIISVMMALLMVMSMLFTGCGEEEPYAYELYDSFGTINGESIDYRLVYFATRCEQASIESYYYDSYGPDMWTEELQSGKTMEESVKDTIVEELENMFVMELYAQEHGIKLTDEEQASIVATAERFMAENSEEAIAKTGATKEIVEKYLTLYTITNKVYEAIVAEADVDFELEEYQRSRISYIKLDRDEYLLLDATEVLNKALKNYDELTGEDGEFDAEECIYGKEGTGDLNITQQVLDAIKDLEDGEVYTELFREEDYYLIVKMVAQFDTTSSATVKETMIEEAQEEKYNEVLEAYKEDVTFELNEEAWAALTFDIHFELSTEE